ncbi:hypothetical protein DYB28_008506, partial [Aphanomyces astaci]
SAAFETSTAAAITGKTVRRGSKERHDVEGATQVSNDTASKPTDFELLVVVGQGAFGKVRALTSSSFTERDIMTKVDHPFLVKLKYAFQTPANVYLVMPYIPGGELFHTLHKQGLLLEFLHADTHSILKQLLERNVDKRLGAGKSTMFKVKGVAAIKQHPFFSRIDWGLLAQRKITPPVTPLLATNTGGLGTLDTSCFAESFTKMQVAVDETQVPDDHGSLFHRFSFTAADVRLRRESTSNNSRINEEEQPIDEHDEGDLVSTISTLDDAATSVVESSTIDPHVAPQC